MIISHKYKFIFIKTVKTAGTSIEVFLSPRCSEDDVFTPIKPYVEGHVARNYKGLWNPFPELLDERRSGILFTLKGLRQRNRYFNHISARLLKQRLPKHIWDNYYKICVERNPWDKTLSHYHMTNKRIPGGITFDQYIKRGVYCHNHQLYTNNNGEVIVDKVIRYESLIDDLVCVFGKLGVPFDGRLDVWAKSDYRRDRRSYREYFSDESRLVVSRAFSKEIELHGYQF